MICWTVSFYWFCHKYFRDLRQEPSENLSKSPQDSSISWNKISSQITSGNWMENSTEFIQGYSKEALLQKLLQNFLDGVHPWSSSSCFLAVLSDALLWSCSIVFLHKFIQGFECDSFGGLLMISYGTFKSIPEIYPKDLRIGSSRKNLRKFLPLRSFHWSFSESFSINKSYKFPEAFQGSSSRVPSERFSRCSARSCSMSFAIPSRIYVCATPWIPPDIPNPFWQVK